MATMTRALKSQRINFRVSKAEAQLLHKGAEFAGKKLTEFIVESACTVAESELAEQREFKLSPEKWRAFLAALDKPTKELTPALRRLLSEPSVIEIANRK
jgi:uncharacterized protein (DUF1778 family)